MKNITYKLGFTLIELLVVVIIIAILAAIAVPQYKKAVVKSRNAEMKHLVKAIADAERVYYWGNGNYAANFNELDIDLPLTPVTTTPDGRAGVCSAAVQGTDSARQGTDFYVALNAGSEDMSQMNVVAYWSSGTYQCAGFAIELSVANGLKKLHCLERKDSRYTAGVGDFCEKIEHGTQLNVADSWRRYYSLP